MAEPRSGVAPGSTRTTVQSVGAGNDPPVMLRGPFNEAGEQVPDPNPPAPQTSATPETEDYDSWMTRTFEALCREFGSGGGTYSDRVDAFDKLCRLANDVGLSFDTSGGSEGEVVSLDGFSLTDTPDAAGDEGKSPTEAGEKDVKRVADTAHDAQRSAGESSEHGPTGKRVAAMNEPTKSDR